MATEPLPTLVTECPECKSRFRVKSARNNYQVTFDKSTGPCNRHATWERCGRAAEAISAQKTVNDKNDGKREKFYSKKASEIPGGKAADFRIITSIFRYKNWPILIISGIAILMLPGTLGAPEVVFYITTPVGLICVFGGLGLYFSGP